MRFLKECDDSFDVVVIDLPDPNTESLNQLYTGAFYRLVGAHLKDGGVFVTQSTSPYYAREAFWCIHRTIAEEGFEVLPYHLQVPSFGDWGFNVASKASLTKDVRVEVPTSYLNDESTRALFAFAKDEAEPEGIVPNTMDRPVLIQYYDKALVAWG